MAGGVIRDMVKNYLSVSAVKDLLGVNVKVRFPVMRVIAPFYETQ